MNRNGIYILGLLALMAVGGWIRAHAMADWPLWSDEAAHWLSTCESVGISWPQFAQWTQEFEAAPFSFVLPRLSTDLLGNESEFALRLPSVICGILCIPVAFLLGRIIHGNAMGLLVAALVTFDPNMVDSAQQVRMYAIFMLLILIGVTWAIHLLRHPERSAWQWIGIGLILGLAWSTTQFGLALWFGVGMAAMLLMIGGKLTGRPYDNPKAAWSGGLMAFLVATLVGHVGIALLLARLGTGGGDATHLTVGEIAREVFIAAKEMINLSPQALRIEIREGIEIPLIELAVYTLAAFGIVQLFRKCKTSTAVIVCLALGNLLMMVPFRRMHHFMAPRYISMIEPALWVGLAFAAISIQKHLARRIVLTLVVAYIGAQAWQCFNIDRWWQQPDRYTVSEQILNLRDTENPIEAGHGVAYHPRVLEKIGHYYEIPTDPLIDDPIYDVNELRENATIPVAYDKPVTWMIVGMVNWDGRVERVKEVVKVFAKHYGVAFDMKKLSDNLLLDRVYVLRFSKEGIALRWASPAEPKASTFLEIGIDKTN